MTTTGLNQLTFIVDFNATDGPYVIARRADALSEHPPRQDDLVMLVDDEGNECEGIVREIRDRTVLVEPLLWTWTHENDVEISGIHPSAEGTIEAVAETSVFELA